MTLLDILHAARALRDAGVAKTDRQAALRGAIALVTTPTQH